MLKGKVRSFVLILVLLAALALVGCGGSETKVTADEVVQNAVSAQADVTSGHVVVKIGGSVEGTVSGQALEVSVDDTMLTADMDWANKKMMTVLGINANYNGLAFQIPVNLYAVDNCSYMQVNFALVSDNWMKSGFPTEFWSSQDSQESLDEILDAIDAESLTSGKVGGVSCHVVQLTPDYDALQAMLEQQADAGEEVPDIESLISNLSIKVWVAKDTSYVMKIEIILEAHLTAEDMGEPESSDVLDINLTLTMEMTKINEPVSIVVPADAQNAEWGNPLDIFSTFSF